MSENKCLHCGSMNISINEAESYDPSKNEWILILVLLAVLYFADGMIRNIAGVGTIIFFYHLYQKEKKCKNRFKLHCFDCGEDFYFYDYSKKESSENANSLDLSNLNLEDDSISTASKVNSKLSAAKAGIIEGIQAGSKNNTIDSSRNNINKMLENIVTAIYKEKFSDEVGNAANRFNEISKDISKFIISESNAKFITIIQQKYPDIPVRKNDTAESLFNNSSISNNIKQDMTIEYYKLYDEIIKGSLVEYVEDKYDVSIESLFDNDVD